MTHPFPGGTSVSRLSVYDWPTTDGAGLVGGGTPHLHLASDEGYVVLSGAGSVQTLGPDGYAEHPLSAGTLLWFQPGVVHRLVNDGDLEILVVMSNAGLPEAGDAVMTFPADVLADAERYAAAATLPVLPALPPGAMATVASSDAATTGSAVTGTVAADMVTADTVTADAARARRDLAVEGFTVLRERVLAEGPDVPMGELYDAAARLVREKVPGWQLTWDSTVRASADRTAAALAALAVGTAPHLRDAATASTQARSGPPRYGMCGRLRTWAL
ncbi:cupin domain-containing protein [Sanguibacter sp. Leaf3]|uniref:cupin domain-containing protein n=1 Tax=Sanguibacter sp. Leaf3 TaxID=1736209 RepID=UPI0006FE3E00|nr:cupin domain-containing protein [Sanguibacter sp. Leaf3]KQT96703.1 cupin [Sanguibacter sp. Leaf3]